MSLLILKKGTLLADLDAWGSFSELGAEILDGIDVQAFGKSTHGTPTDAVNAGYFGTTKGKYRMIYPFSEQAIVLHGEVSITDESTGVMSRFGPGDSWFITKGTPTLWEVLSETYTKHYLSFA